MNTLLCYRYRDASNYKTFSEVIISDTLELDDIRPFLFDKEFFIPSEVGLPDLQNEVFSEDDHIWHEIDSIEFTNDEPTVNFNTLTLIDKFRIANDINWNQYNVFKRKGLL